MPISGGGQKNVARKAGKMMFGRKNKRKGRY